ncbi:hypothetical protein EWM64_g9611 [Hericium alpestre]|uniref:Uncharacterized protein n=1 Tax=Hericium alpestre TaxID=135208 RepID=A0A4Y9ZKN1_9AGAM|nr:hypothetical protein EWM64_g9611 [Hericium alpestre]
MGKNKCTAKAAWRAAAAASIAASTTGPVPSLVAPVTAHDTPTAIDMKEPTPAPTQQPCDVPTQNACLTPRTSSLASNATSASPSNTPTSRSHPAPPFANEREPDRNPIPTTHEPGETRNERPQLAARTTSPASPTPTATPHGSLATPHSTIPPASTDRHRDGHPAVTEHELCEARNERPRPAPCTALPASHMPTATPHNNLAQPRRIVRPSAVENELQEGLGPWMDRVCTASDAYGEGTHTVCTTAPHAPRPHSPTPRDSTSPPSNTTRSPAAVSALADLAGAHTGAAHDARGPNARTAPHTTSLASRTRTAAPRDVPAPPSNTTQPSETADEPRSHDAACEDVLHAHTVPRAPRSEQPTSPRDVPIPAHNNAKTSALGFEPGKPQAAAVLLFKEPDGKLLDPVHLKEIVATALRDGHAAGLKEGRNHYETKRG